MMNLQQMESEVRDEECVSDPLSQREETGNMNISGTH